MNILLDQGVPSSRIGIGVPAFGRAVANAALCSGGLFQQLTNDSLAPGDPFTDPPQPPPCESRPPNFTCSGSFDYNYIVDKMLSPDQPPDGTIVRYSREDYSNNQLIVYRVILYIRLKYKYILLVDKNNGRWFQTHCRQK